MSLPKIRIKVPANLAELRTQGESLHDYVQQLVEDDDFFFRFREPDDGPPARRGTLMAALDQMILGTRGSEFGSWAGT